MNRFFYFSHPVSSQVEKANNAALNTSHSNIPGQVPRFIANGKKLQKGTPDTLSSSVTVKLGCKLGQAEPGVEGRSTEIDLLQSASLKCSLPHSSDS